MSSINFTLEWKKTLMNQLPLVSICTVTYQRPGLLLLLEERIKSQTYPLEKIQWVILDDSPQPHKHYSNQPATPSDLKIKYVHLTEKLPLGKKRNECHSHCNGEIIIYMDDDDFYPPSRVEHAVKSLLKSNKEIAGSSILPILFIDNADLWIAGPYGENHATAGTFAFKRSLLECNNYKNEDTSGEEKEFLRNYTTPMVQLDPFQTIICIAHESNTYNKHQMLPEPGLDSNPEYKMKRHNNLSESQTNALKMIAEEHARARLSADTIKSGFQF